MPHFNLTNRIGVLTDNWREDRVLVADGYKARIEGGDAFTADTFERVVPRSRASDSMKTAKTVMEAALEVINLPKSRPAPPPRAVALKAQIATEADAEVSSTFLKPRPYTVPRVSETKQQYVAYEPDLYASMLVKKENAAKFSSAETTLPGRVAPGTGAREAIEPAVEFGISANTELYKGTHYLDCPPMTFFSARGPEGLFSGAGGVTTLAATAALENTGVLSGTVKPATLSGRGSGSAPWLPAPGSELSMKLLFTRFVRRLRDAGSSPEALLEALAPLVGPPEEEQPMQLIPGSALSKFGSGMPSNKPKSPQQLAEEEAAAEAAAAEAASYDGVPARLFRKACYAVKLAMPDTDLQSIIAACDLRKDRRVSLAALAHFMSDIGSA